MTKQTREKEKEEPRRVGPKFTRNVLPETFQIRRPSSPMAELLDEAARGSAAEETQRAANASGVSHLPTPVNFTPVKIGGVRTVGTAAKLPSIDDFLDEILPRFPPARQAVLLRLYRWSEGEEQEIVVSTVRLAAKTNMDEKSCRTHLQALVAEGFVVRSQDGEQVARFGGSDRNARGLLLKLSSAALFDLLA